jgi:hypothetical protein
MLAALNATISALPRLGAIHRLHKALNKAMGEDLARYVFQGLTRSTFFIELVKTPKIETTKFEVRWATRLGADDPRFAEYEECLATMQRSLETLLAEAGSDEKLYLLRLFRDRGLLPYEIPLDYSERKADRPVHRRDNMLWLWDPMVKRTLALRNSLLGTSNALKKLFEAVYDKIRVKTYLTDRVLTGEYKTNREKRWEVHPGSVHFAFRRSCLEIEFTLMNQLCHFQGFPAGLLSALVKEGMLPPAKDVFRCPVTLEPLSFDKFQKEVLDPTMGKSSFQVGHLNPLKATNDDPRQGHTAQNISWVSSNGNRIQGSLSLDETKALLRRIVENYQRFKA